MIFAYYKGWIIIRKRKTVQQEVRAYAHLPRIYNPEGERVLVDDPDLWFASKVNATLKEMYASEVYWQKKLDTPEKQQKFIRGVRNHSWNRQHMGSMVVSGIDFEAILSSLVSSAIALGKFYKMQQQTRRSVILQDTIDIPALREHEDVKNSFEDRFSFYWDIVDKRSDKIKGFDPIVQDAFKILPLATKTRISGQLDLRTVKGYARWKNLEYLPSSVRDFGNKLDVATQQEFPIMYKSFNLREQNTSNEEMYNLQLKMIDKIGSDDLMEEPMLWYNDHSFLLDKNPYFEKLYKDFQLDKLFANSGPDAMLMGYFNPVGLQLDDLKSLFKNKDEATKSMTELMSVAFISKIDMSGGIDTWRHTRSNRVVQPIYHALENGNQVAMPALYQRKSTSGSDVPDIYMEKSRDTVALYHQLVKEGVEKREAINVIPHNFELIQIEITDIFSFLNMMAIRTCIHARPGVQEWAKALLRETGKIPDFKGIDQISEERSNLLARGIVFNYCAEMGNCKKCGKEVIYLPDPLVS